MTDKLSELNEKYYKLFWRLENNKKGMSLEMYTAVQEKLKIQYLREYDLLNYTDGAPLEKEIAELKRAYDKQTLELEVLQKTAEKAAEIKRREIIPDTRKKRFMLFWQKETPNYALQLTEEAAQIEINDYLDELELHVDGKTGKTAEAIYERLKDSVPRPHSRRKREEQEQQLRKLAQTLAHALTQSRAQEQLEEILKKADSGNALDEPQDDKQPDNNPEPPTTATETGTEPPKPGKPEQTDEPGKKPTEGKETNGTPDPRGGAHSL